MQVWKLMSMLSESRADAEVCFQVEIASRDGTYFDGTFQSVDADPNENTVTISIYAYDK